MTFPLPFSRLPARVSGRPALAAAGLMLAGAVVGAPLAAQSYAYGRSMANDPAQCAPGQGPSARVVVTGLKSGAGNLFVRAYPARSSDWLESKRYIMRIDAKPQNGTVTVCVPLPARGDYAIAVHHDVNGNRKSDLSDGAGMSNNPGIKKILGLVPRPPALEKVRFAAGDGVTRMTINMQYM